MQGKETWRVNRDGVVRDPYRNLTYVFEMEERDFFEHYVGESKNNTIMEVCNDTARNLRGENTGTSLLQYVGRKGDCSSIFLRILYSILAY